MSSTLKLPGMIDIHTHLREPGATQKEDFYTGTSAGLAGGVTTVIDMPNNPIPTISKEAFDQKLQLAQAKSVCDFGLNFGASSDDNTGEFPWLTTRAFGLKVYMDQTTGTLQISNKSLLEKIFKSWPKEKPLFVHAESEHVKLAIDLAKKINRRIHICHVSTILELDFIKAAKEEGFSITCEVTPQHLFLTEEDAKLLGPYGLVKPPLRAKSDVEYLWKNLGFIDCIATDHAPHTKEEKESNNPPFGMPGLETALPLLLTAVSKGRLTLDQVINLYSTNPSKLFGIHRDDQTYVEVEPDYEYEIKNENLITKCGWSPFNGWKVKGKIRNVFIRGEKVFKDGEILAKKGFGKMI